MTARDGEPMGMGERVEPTAWLPDTPFLANFLAETSEGILLSTHRPPGEKQAILYANNAFLKMSGYSLPEVLGRSPSIFHGPQTDARSLEAVYRAIAAGGTYQGPLTKYRKDGTSYRVDCSLSPLRNADGDVTHWVTLQRDVTERDAQREKLRASEERLSLTIDASGDGIFDWNVATGELFWSPRCMEIVGLSSERFVPRASTFFDRLVPEDRERVEAAVQAHFERHIPFVIEYELFHEDGSRLPIAARGQAAWDEAGQPIRMVGTMRDISHARSLESRLLEAEEMAQMGHWVLDLRQGGTSWSPGTYRIHGLEQEAMGTAIPQAIDCYHPDDRDAIRNALKRAADSGQGFTLDARLVREDGALRFVRVNGNVARDARGKPIRLFGIIQDRTTTVMQERQLEQAQRLQAFGQLAGGVAHDFNNLLAVIMGNLELLQDLVGSRVDEDDKQLIQEAMRAATRGRELTQSLLSFARAAPLRPEVIAPDRLRKDLSEILRRTLPATISVQFTIEPGTWPVQADAGNLEGVLLNLALNARDAMPDGGTLTIETCNRRLDEADVALDRLAIPPGPYVSFAVGDSGHGIPAEVQERVFEPFFTTKPAGLGSGLGLARVKGFAEQSGGTVRLYSEPGQGTSVVIYLPAHGSGPIENDAAPDSSRPSAFPRARVLLVEDLPEVRKVMRLRLEREGLCVTEAETGDQAMALVEGGADFDILLTDIVMPGSLQGFELASEVRKKRPGIKVIFMSGHARDALMRPGVGDDDIRLTKPISRAELFDALKRVLSQAADPVS